MLIFLSENAVLSNAYATLTQEPLKEGMLVELLLSAWNNGAGDSGTGHIRIHDNGEVYTFSTRRDATGIPVLVELSGTMYHLV